MLTINMNVSQRCIFHPNPKDILGNPVTPGVLNYVMTDPNVLQVDVTGPDPDIVPTIVGATIITIRGADVPGSEYVTEQVQVNVGPSNLHHFSPTAEAPRVP